MAGTAGKQSRRPGFVAVIKNWNATANGNDKANADALKEELAKLRAEIEALKNATNENIEKAESNAQVLPTVIASVAVLGDIALLVWFIIKRKIVK